MQSAAFFGFPKCRKANFQCFPCFPMLGNAIFSVFYLSEGSEMRFSAFFIFPRGQKCDFQRFSSFRGVGNAVFGVFHLSEGLEMRFLAFFVFPRGWKCDFQRSSSFRGVRNAVFGVFRLSNPLEAERCLNRIHVISELPPMFFLVRMLWKSLCELLSEKMIETYAVMNHPVDLSPIG